MVSKAYVDQQNSKQGTAIADKANKSDILNHQVIFYNIQVNNWSYAFRLA